MHSTWTKNWCWYPQNTCFLEQNAGSKHIPALSTSRCFKSFLHYRTSQVCFFSGLFYKLLLIEGLEDSIDVLRRNTNPRIIHFNVNLPFLIVIAARHRDASLMCEPGSGVSKLHLESWKKNGMLDEFCTHVRFFRFVLGNMFVYCISVYFISVIS